MSNIAKSAMKRTRDRLFSNIINSLNSLELLVKELRQGQMAQAQSNQVILGELAELNRKVRNSGTIQISEFEVMTKIFSGAKMYLDPRDIALVPHLILDGDWEREITNAWLSVIREGDTILDIGANFGYFSVLAVQQAHRNCSVILFEANPQLIPYIKKTMDVNSFDNCSKVENLAVSNEKGRLKLNILEGYVASSSMHDIETINKYNRVKQKVASRVDISSTTIDDYCKINNIKRVDLIKMDIEGFEERAYEGMRKTIKSSPNVTMFVEFTKEGYSKPKSFYEQMLSDFGTVYLVSQEGRFERPNDISYKTVVGDTEGWVMLVFSKNKKLAN